VKAALYSRVSTDGQDQKKKKNALILRAEKEGWDYDYFEERESTQKTRPIKFELYQCALRGDYDIICVWKIDRWARSAIELSREIETLYKRGVKFISLSDPIDLSSDTGWMQFQIISVFAEFERRLISTRTKEGLKNAKNVGKRGRDKRPRRKSGYYLRWANDKKRGPTKSIDNSL